MSYIACDAEGNCRIIDDENPEETDGSSDLFKARDASMQHDGELRKAKEMMSSTRPHPD